jgi:predicted house-cleaning noncanonical NTP pyrophosphatase (MazG superfamily)
MTKEPKLIRDRVPVHMRAQGKDPITYTATRGELALALRNKLLEESREVWFARDDGDWVLEELADVTEVVRAILEFYGFTLQELEEVRLRKLREKGGFTRQIMWAGNRPAKQIENSTEEND